MIEPDDACRRLLLVVARAPLPGFSKTRLGKSIGMDAAAQLHRAFLEDIVAAFFAADLPLEGVARGWAYTPETFDFPALISELSPATDQRSIRYVVQTGDHLGERLTNLFAWAIEQGFDQTLIMASDSPQLSPAVVCQGFLELTSDDLVIGRVLDGGYYLVGSRGYTDLLARVPMSTANAADALCEAAMLERLTVAELPCEFDIDVVDDLKFLIERLTLDPEVVPASYRMLQSLGFMEPR